MNYRWKNDNQEGVYIIRGDGRIFNKSDSGEHRTNCSLKFLSGDVVCLQYFSSSETLIIKNNTRNLSHILKNIKEQPDNPLHFCVHLYFK